MTEYPYLLKDRDFGLASWQQSWIAHPSGGIKDDAHSFLIYNRGEIKVWGEVSDNEASYSYDDYALVQLGRKFYLLETSGCSCPDPKETWYIVLGPLSLAKLVKAFHDKYSAQDYGVPIRQGQDFQEMFQKARNK